MTSQYNRGDQPNSSKIAAAEWPALANLAQRGPIATCADKIGPLTRVRGADTLGDRFCLESCFMVIAATYRPTPRMGRKTPALIVTQVDSNPIGGTG